MRMVKKARGVNDLASPISKCGECTLGCAVRRNSSRGFPAATAVVKRGTALDSSLGRHNMTHIAGSAAHSKVEDVV